MLGSVIQLDGDSYTPEGGVEGELHKRLARHATSWMGQSAMIRAAGKGGFSKEIALRLALLEKPVPEHGQALIIGRPGRDTLRGAPGDAGRHLPRLSLPPSEKAGRAGAIRPSRPDLHAEAHHPGRQ